MSDADFKSLWDQIKEDIDQWYQTSDNQIVFSTVRFIKNKKRKISIIFKY